MYKRQQGHLAEVQAEVVHLSQLKDKLLDTDTDFKTVYDKALPFIQEGMELAKGAIKDEIQLCLNGIYGLLLLRMNGKKIPDTLMQSLDNYGELLSYLSYKYKQEKFTSSNWVI